MRRIGTALFVLALVVGLLSWTFRKTIAVRLMQRVVTANLESNLIDELPDGPHVALCGAGSPLPDADRSGPCVAVIAGKRLFIVDAGSGASRILARSRIPQGKIDAIFLTHFHSDHIDGLGELLLQRWAGSGRAQPAPVYGGPGVEQVVAGFNTAYAQDVDYRVAHHGPQIMPRGGAGATANPIAVPPVGVAQTVLSEGDLTVTAFRVDHTPVTPALGYRFDYKDRSAVISGDTVKTANVQKFAQGVDLLIHEALSPELVAVIHRAAESAGNSRLAKITADIVGYHTSPREAAEIARDAKVGYLLYYHIVPPLPLKPLEEVFLEGTGDIYDGPITLGRDGTLITMPAGSSEIEQRDLL